MQAMKDRSIRITLMGLFVAALALTGCGKSANYAASTVATTAGSKEAGSTTEAGSSTAPMDSMHVTGSTVGAAANACPIDGCRIEITKATKAAGGEISLDFSANFAPDESKNHIHVYWDRYTSQQVSGDAATRFNVKQGDWIPTATVAGFVTEGAVSVTVREQSHTVCVTAGDRNHNVLDPSITNCRDVGDLL